MGQTSNYGHRQWENWEAPRRTALNEVLGQIDSAIKTTYDLADGKASVVLGTYTANGQSSQNIHLGFSPKALILVTREGYLDSPFQAGYRLGGVIFPQMEFEAVYLTSSGFTVTMPEDQGQHTPNSQKYSPYYYIAFCLE